MGGLAERRGTPERVTRLLLIGQVLLAAIGIVVWRLTGASAPPPPPFPTAEPLALLATPATLETGLDVAWRQARAWRDGAQLLNATMQVDWPWDPVPPGPVTRVPGTGWLTYVFVAPWDPSARRVEAASLSILVERLSGTVAAQTTLDWEQAPDLPPPAATPALSSTDAVLVAEAAGGTAFRRGCPIDRHLTRVSLVTGTDSPPHWVVTYQDARKPEHHGLLIRIDAASGEVLASVAGDVPPCNEAADP